MNRETTAYAQGTSLTVSRPWGFYIAGRTVCSDGKVRALKRISATADTFFSVPAAVTVQGKTVSGYITMDTLNDERSVVYFCRYSYGKNAGLLPEGKHHE